MSSLECLPQGTYDNEIPQDIRNTTMLEAIILRGSGGLWIYNPLRGKPAWKIEWNAPSFDPNASERLRPSANKPGLPECNFRTSTHRADQSRTVVRYFVNSR